MPWKITKIVTSLGRCWQTVAAALIQIIYHKSAEMLRFQRTYRLKAPQTWLTKRLHKAAWIHPFHQTSHCSRNILGPEFFFLSSLIQQMCYHMTEIESNNSSRQVILYVIIEQWRGLFQQKTVSFTVLQSLNINYDEDDNCEYFRLNSWNDIHKNE